MCLQGYFRQVLQRALRCTRQCQGVCQKNRLSLVSDFFRWGSTPRYKKITLCYARRREEIHSEALCDIVCFFSRKAISALSGYGYRKVNISARSHLSAHMLLYLKSLPQILL